jgi:hypothetical protein
METFIEEYRDHVPQLQDAKKREPLESWLVDAMIIKMDLLVSSYHHKLAFPPPGAPYDPSIVAGEDDDWWIPDKEHASHYRVKVCISPALIKNVAGSEWTDEDSIDSRPMTTRTLCSNRGTSSRSQENTRGERDHFSHLRPSSFSKKSLETPHLREDSRI